ncbi:hypothetical protein OVS_02765 [Mycoplasma ovis str. Michigan]|uniref:Uncharacterized protein n=1 Tax=Mycoplasma ovis str. Michigan TaxID=1415773 RepID=A0ABM5P1P5_9MOLU|nr:hypothetical protein OVS_02765 [Mycoplasma ovis str. Michigan]
MLIFKKVIINNFLKEGISIQGQDFHYFGQK